jgi:hypothetical protein
VPSSELAMHLGADKKGIVAFFVTANTAHIIYDNGEEGCEYVDGLINELLTPELAEAAKSRIVGSE